ncbi:MAG: 50S ribosomal protein L23 [Chloroflexi bacterium RBG_16_54_18]|nr:MAG: 50S ribosomal protein L23 [Chloroflexi bacterium RBG_16_54_18]
MINIHEVLRRPIITEKSNYLNGKLHQYAFEVADEATKSIVKEAVEDTFDVNVIRVNIISMPMKQKRNQRSRRQTVRRSAYKKAIVTLAPGDTIGVFEGVK